MPKQTDIDSQETTTETPEPLASVAAPPAEPEQFEVPIPAEDVVIDIDDSLTPPPVDEDCIVPDPDPALPTVGRVPYVVHEGKRFSPAFRDALKELARLLPFAFRITQGGFNKGVVKASGTTHDGDSVDFSVKGLSQSQVTQLISTARRLGIAAWFRTTKTAKWGTRAQGFGSYHVHGVPNGWGLPSPSAKDQAASYRRGKDGLRSQQADLGPGHVTTHRTQTWQSYRAGGKAPKAIVVDGDFGPQTKKRLQLFLGVTQDGDFGPVTKRALRRWLGVSDAKEFDATAIKALQKVIGTTVDGDFGPVSVKALQRYLNTNPKR